PHEPWDPPKHYQDLYDPGYVGELLDHPEYTYCDRQGATPAEVKHAKALYAGEVTLVDTWVGRVLEKLDLCGQLDDTVVIFHSDHGHYVGDYGRFGKDSHTKDEPAWPYYEEVSHVPLMIRAPGGPRGRTNPFLAQAVDIMPTILDLAGLSAPEGMKGVSLAPALRGEPLPERAVAITTQTLNGPTARVGRQMSSITDGEWTLHYRGNEEPWELYNVVTDPKQKDNLCKSRRVEAERLHAEHLKQLRYAGVSDEAIRLRSRLP
ncbi:MAG: sulfatase-like hydrolase/transferase, partial [Candidatus Sumerlaeota bacterium]|nr:sulfatase-like hydrolase/transferase [Candidatus Sumerlaeota bacterium]